MEPAVSILVFKIFRPVLNVVCFLLGNSPASKFYIPTFRNTMFHLHTYPPMKLEHRECSEKSAYKIQTPRSCPEGRIKHLYVLYTKQLFPATCYSH